MSVLNWAYGWCVCKALFGGGKGMALGERNIGENWEIFCERNFQNIFEKLQWLNKDLLVNKLFQMVVSLHQRT